MNSKSPTSEEEVLSLPSYICTSPSLIPHHAPNYLPLLYKKSFQIICLVFLFEQIPPSPQSASQLALDSRLHRYQYKEEDGKYPTCRTHRIWTLKGETSSCCDRWSASCKMKWVLCKNRHECNRPLRNWTINCGTLLIREFHSCLGSATVLKLPQRNTDDMLHNTDVPLTGRHIMFGQFRP